MAPALRSMPVPPPRPSPPAEQLSDDEDDGDDHWRAGPPQPGCAASASHASAAAARHVHHGRQGRHHSQRSGSAAGAPGPGPGLGPDSGTALDDMGSSGSRQHGGKQGHGQHGLLGRRTQSSGSLCSGDKLGRLLAPCGRHRHRGNHLNHNDYNCSHHHNHAGDDCHRHLR